MIGAVERALIIELLPLLFWSVCADAPSAEWYVDCSAVGSHDGKSWATAFKTIQQGIDAASHGDTVVVAQGTYRENMAFKGKNIVLRSTDPSNSAIVSKTIIDGQGASSVVTFAGTEKESCVLSGFTIRNGRAIRGAGICGGTWDYQARVTIQNNVIVGNYAEYEGGGLFLCNGIIQNNVIKENSSGQNGGGLYDCDGAIQNNVISGNATRARLMAEASGGGLDSCQGTIRNNIITNNSSVVDGGGPHYCDGIVEGNVIARNSARSNGGGLGWCRGTVRNNVVYENSAPRGGGLASCFGKVVNNTIVGNSADIGGGLSDCDISLPGCDIRNCIIWGNTASEGPGLVASRTPSYSCIENWTGGGTGNISLFPHFVDPGGGDYHLSTWSPCIDAGDPASDFSKEHEPNGGRIDMGAYGNTPEATSKSPDSDADGLPDDWEMHFFGDLAQVAEGDTDRDGISNADEYFGGTRPIRMSWYVDRSRPNSGDGTSWEKAFRTIQEAIDLAYYPDTVLVAPGVYFENVCFKGKNIVLTSTDPSDPGIVAKTIIDGNGAGPVVTFEGTEGENCVLSGFTIRNGRATSGGGICGRTTGAGNRATIQNNLIVGNSAQSDGGGLAFCDGVVQHNTIKANSAERHGGGLFFCSGTIRRNIISGNLSQFQGGGLHSCGGIIRNNAIIANSADEGGGMHGCNGTIENNTIVANVADGPGAALNDCSGTVHNCIIWGNKGKNLLSGGATMSYCCIERWTGDGEGNVPYFPYFVDAANGDYHLKNWSPCIDAGDSSSDFSNEPQPNGGRVDIGMFGNTSEATSASEDSDEDLLPDDWELTIFRNLAYGGADDLDNDGLPNRAEYLFSTSPENQDTDGDQMPDAWEVENALDPLTDNAAEDADMDGLTNVQEYLSLTNPNSPDSDNDDLLDGAEVNIHHTNPLKPDTDNDGKNDGQEVAAGTDPLDVQSLFRIVEIVCTPFGTAVRWAVVPNRTYQCYVSSNLRTWSPLGGSVTPGPFISTHSVFDWESVQLESRYYRVSVRQ